jgi:hypothetical protein
MLMDVHSMRRWNLCLAILLSVASTSGAADGGLTRELDGTTLSYQYEGGRRYDIRFDNTTIAWQRLDLPGRNPSRACPTLLVESKRECTW